jgi:hypothetical protein
MVTAMSRDVASVDMSNEKIDRKASGQSIDEQLEQFFASVTKVQKLFMINGSKVGIFFDPSGKPIKVGYTTVRDKVALASDDLIPQQVTQKIKAKLPSGCTYSMVIIEKINGIPFFQFLGLE